MKELQIYDFQDFYLFKNHGMLSETGPYAKIFRAVPCQYFSVPLFSVPGRAKIFRAMIFRAGPCHKSPGPPFRAVPGRPWSMEN